MASAVIGVPLSGSRNPKISKYTGLPWRWISTMAPGMRPAATSPLMKSSIGASFSIDSSAPGGGPSWTVAADKGDASMTAAKNGAIGAAKRGNDVKRGGNIYLSDQSVARRKLVYCRDSIQI